MKSSAPHSVRRLALLFALFAPGAGFGQAESEPNDSKLLANPVALPLSAATGVVTGNSTSESGSGPDYFLVSTPARPLAGFYRHRLILTSPIAGHFVLIRGLNQVAGVPGGTDITFQAGSVATSPARFIQWYTSQSGGDLFVRVVGDAATTADYALDYEVQPVTELNGPAFTPGSIVITTVGQSAPQVDTDLWVYDDQRQAIVDFGNDEEFGTGSSGSKLTRDFPPGVYYLAISNSNLGNNLGSPDDDDNRNRTVADFPGVLLNSSIAANLDLASMIDGSPQAATKAGPFEVVFVRFGEGLFFSDGFESGDTAAWHSTVSFSE